MTSHGSERESGTAQERRSSPSSLSLSPSTAPAPSIYHGQEERYYVTKSSGFMIRPATWASSGRAVEIVEVMILDRDYCHNLAWSSLKDGKNWYTRRLPKLRDEAHRLCAEWNAEDRADAA